MPQPQPTPSLPPETLPGDISARDLSKHRGHWLAYSAEEGRLIASCLTLKELDSKIRAAGEDPEEVLLDRIPAGDTIHSGSELS